MKKLLLFCCVYFSITQSSTGNTFEYDGSGDLKPPEPTVSDLSQRIRDAFDANPLSLQKRHRTKTKVKRIVRTVLPGLMKTYLDFHLPEFVHLYVSELFQSDDVIVPACPEQDRKIEKLEGDVVRMRSRINHMGARMDELERIVEEYRKATEKNHNLDPKNKTFLETDRNVIDQVEILATEDVPLLQRSDTAAGTPPTPNISCVQQFLPAVNINLSSITESTSEIIAVSIEDPQFYVFANGNKTTFQVQSKKVRSVVYDPTTRNLIWSNYSSANPGIFSASLRRPAKVKRLSNMSSEGMAVDPCNRWLFFTTISPRPTISKMTIRGRHYRKIKDMSKYGTYMYSVAVDPDNELIYTCHQSVLAETSYDGKIQKELVSEGTAIFAVSLDLTNRMLYYGSWGEIKQLSLGDGVTKTVLKVASSPRNLIFYNNLLYGDKGKLIQVFDVQNLVTVDVGKMNGTAISICLIP